MDTLDNNEFMTYDKLLVSNGVSLTDIQWLDPTITFVYDFLTNCLIRNGIKKVALLKKSDKSDFEIIVKCPHCQHTFYQRKITKKFQCPNCMKISPIVISIGVVGTLSYKKKNDTVYDNSPYHVSRFSDNELK